MGFHTALSHFSCGVKAGDSFDFVLAVKTCCCSGSFEEVEVPSFGLVVSGVDADIIAAKEFYKFTMKYFVKKATRYCSVLNMKTFYTQWNI